MDEFNQIKIDCISKRDLFVILQALEYTYEHTQINEFADLKNILLDELSNLTDIPNFDDIIRLLSAS